MSHARQAQLPRRALALAAAALALALAGCGSAPLREEPEPAAYAYGTQKAPPDSRARGGYYKDDGPGENAPDPDRVLDAEPRAHPLHRFANNPYTVFGRTYTPMKSIAPFTQRGLASWYGRRFHGQRTSSGEPYDMYAMTAAHPTLPIPSYARVTNLRNQRTVVVKINDRGPFLAERIVDLSYTAAAKLGYVGTGSAQVEVELIQPQDFARYARRTGGMALAAADKPDAQRRGAISLISSAQAAQSAAPPGAPVYLQLGSFGVRANAEALRERVANELPWLRDFVRTLERDGGYRVSIGPYANRADAAAAAERVRESLRLEPLLVDR